jgi:type IV pilus assembly protein PilA
MQLTRSWRRRGFSLIELLIVVGIILLILMVAIPNAMNAHLNAVETVVMREVQTIYQAQIQYHSQFGEYASTLAELGPPANGVAGPAAAKLVPPSLASGEKDGYLFSVNRTTEGFAVNANPKVFGRNGRRTFYLDQDGNMHQNWGPEPATATSPELK